MNRPPRSRHERVLQPTLLARAYIFLGGFEAITAMAAFFYVWPRLGYVPATTACLAAIVITQLVNVQLCRSGRESLFTSIRQWNTLLVAGMGIEVVLILVIVYAPVGNLVFGTAPIGADAWLFMLPFATAMVTGEEIRKWIVRTNSRLANKHVPLTAN